MSLAHRSKTLLALLAVSAVCSAQVSQKPAPLKQATKKPSLSRTVGGGSTQLVAAGSDDCSAPQAIAGQGTFSFDTTAATTGAAGQNEYLCYQFGVSGIDNDVWFHWTADISGTASINTCAGTSIDTKLAVYPESGGCPPPGSVLAVFFVAAGLFFWLFLCFVAAWQFRMLVASPLATFPK